MQITIAIKVRYYQITEKYLAFLLVSLLFKMVHTYMVKLMKQKKVKTRMTPCKSRMAFRRTRNEKRERSNPLKTGFWRCIMQITIAIKNMIKRRRHFFHLIKRMKQRKREANYGRHFDKQDIHAEACFD
ncbi:hypothetical protein T4D_10083 [Trichinella pseudospiralis]|uniref:Uncharacterized protein n=1 Tax=Trichinella pseudospiralis TaxID=6337 RepID=A0A0V1FH46_TRIPS|nr:hypothetical protein T4D_10083 [Trichinella pseudospiralis]